MMTFTTALNTLAMAWGFALLTGCATPPAIGGPCEIVAPTGESNLTTITSAALECQGRVCVQASGGPALCSAECSQPEDCENAAAGLCRAGFTCAVAVRVGNYACRRFCLCRDNLGPPSSCAP
jgi:hypothetical protein